MTGYLTQKGKEVDGRYCLAIPNQEIKNIVTERILTLFRNDVRKDGRAVCSNKTDLRERLYAEAETGWH